ncbi:MAG TPA: 4Fe-4S dicluster domain-containing protein [Candidatus Bathyarchaeia archaeon]|nr:4Fe-4S dicluster domain-containing protein [Candidatus Bathyarchaeia archaeon]
MGASQTLENPREQEKTVACIRCGVCLRSCSHNLSPVLIKEAFEKNKKETLRKLRVDLCEGCGNCTYVCPSRIDLRVFVLKAKASVR